MSARDYLPAHLVPPGELHGDFGRLTFGTPPSPSVELRPPAIVTVRPAGERGSELLLVIDGRQQVVPLTYGHLVNLIEDAAAGLRRCENKENPDER